MYVQGMLGLFKGTFQGILSGRLEGRGGHGPAGGFGLRGGRLRDGAPTLRRRIAGRLCLGGCRFFVFGGCKGERDPPPSFWGLVC